MRLKTLEIKGFKSFADKTVLNFDEGITGVIGPNGCGKSNIIDSIRWVIGEHKISNLRSVASSPPVDWPTERRLGYVEFCRKVVAGLRGANARLEGLFLDAAQAAHEAHAK